MIPNSVADFFPFVQCFYNKMLNSLRSKAFFHTLFVKIGIEPYDILLSSSIMIWCIYLSDNLLMFNWLSMEYEFATSIQIESGRYLIFHNKIGMWTELSCGQ